MQKDTEALELVMRSMAVPGVSCDERLIVEAIRSILLENVFLREAIYKDDAHRRSAHGGECGNLIINMPGSMEGQRLLFSAHMDMVSVDLGAEPVIEGDHIVSSSGGGVAADNRAGVARETLPKKGVSQWRLSIDTLDNA